MKNYLTEYTAINEDGEIKTFSGPVIRADTLEQAELICKLTSPHCWVAGEFVKEVS